MPESPLPSRFAHWFEQEGDALQKTIASFDTVPPDRSESPEVLKAGRILAHMVVARSIWLSRFDGSFPTSPPLFPEGQAVATTAAQWEGIRQAWQGFLADLTDDQLAREFAYRSSDGGEFRNTVEEALVQLFTHSAYHRGQIAMLIRSAGGEPAKTDFIYWSRRRSA